ncbi:MAG: tRNA glutamyl-Q(34) synthetase GluQRS [Pseudomonadota bacterium]
MACEQYIGRFAPSPTGPLHLGSLTTAVASYLDARAHRGRWLLRIEDIDPPREVPGAADLIARQLEAHGLHWDGPILYQSRRLALYEDALTRLADRGLLYPCTCSRQRLHRLGGRYDGLCRARGALLAAAPGQPGALRVCVAAAPLIEYRDFLRGAERIDLGETGDFIVRRRDGLIAYQLAVAVDDAAQGITHVLRGADLAESTPRQIFLLRALQRPIPSYGHAPLVCDTRGRKLSKQNRAPALRDQDASANLFWALRWLGLEPDTGLAGATPLELLEWGVRHWSRPGPI